MHDLRLIGVHEDGQHLLMSDSDGKRYRMPLDDTLRAAMRRDRPRMSQLQIESEGGLRPRDVQSLIRQGFAAEDVAQRAGWSVEKVRRYEGPILAEREHVVTLAQRVHLSARRSSPDATLEGRVRERLHERGVETEKAQWDSYRDDEGEWTVVLTFPAGGRERTATWHFNHIDHTITAWDDEARWLSEDDVPPRAADGTEVFDAERAQHPSTYGRARQQPDYDEAPPEPPVDLAAMREQGSRRGKPARRRGASEPAPADETPTVPTPSVAAPAPQPVSAPSRSASEARASTRTRQSAKPDEPKRRPAAQARPSSTPSPQVGQADAGPQPAPTSATAASPAPPASAPEPAKPAAKPKRPAARKPQRGGRASVPSWDDIVFGTRGDDS